MCPFHIVEFLLRTLNYDNTCLHRLQVGSSTSGSQPHQPDHPTLVHRETPLISNSCFILETPPQAASCPKKKLNSYQRQRVDLSALYGAETWAQLSNQRGQPFICPSPVCLQERLVLSASQPQTGGLNRSGYMPRAGHASRIPDIMSSTPALNAQGQPIRSALKSEDDVTRTPPSLPTKGTL